MQNATLRLELFVSDLSASIDFYTRVLGFSMLAKQSDGYTPLQKGNVRISLNLLEWLPDDHPIYVASHERAGRGIEIVLEVDDVAAMFEHVKTQGSAQVELMTQAWGLTDFRIADPDSYYWRITSRA